MVALSAGGEIGPDAFGATPRGPIGGAGSAAETAPEGDGLSLREQLDALELNLIAKMLATTGGNQTEARRPSHTPRARTGWIRGSVRQRVPPRRRSAARAPLGRQEQGR